MATEPELSKVEVHEAGHVDDGLKRLVAITEGLRSEVQQLEEDWNRNDARGGNNFAVGRDLAFKRAELESMERYLKLKGLGPTTDGRPQG